MAALSSREFAPFGGTPFKKSSASVSFTSSYSLPPVPVVEDAIKHELNGYCYADLDQDTFFDTLLSGEGMFGADIKSTSEAIFRSLKDDGLYVDADPENENEKPARWKYIPVRPNSEQDLYDPLLDIIQKITDRCYDTAGIDGGGHFRLNWTSPHNTPILSERRAIHKPDIVSRVSGWEWEESIGGEDPNDEEYKAKEEVWWRVIHTMIEVKKLLDETAVIQMFRYARQCLIEQPDRRFLYGFVFAATNLQVWLIERSGAFSPRQFSIHERPELFVQAFVAIALKSPVTLGWDTSMKICKNVNRKGVVDSVPSWEMALPQPGTAEQRVKLLRSRQWHVSVGEHDYIMFRTDALAKAEVIRGRATRVWSAWNVADMHQPRMKRPVYIIKDCWRDESRGLESEVYETLGDVDGVARMVWFGIVELPGPDGQPQADNTANFIRQGLKPDSDATPIRLLGAGESKTILDRSEDGYTLLTNSAKYWKGEQFALFPYARALRNREHSRLVLRDSGCPIYNFMTLHELFSALHDAMNGVLNMYTKRVLHRDISTNNILINSEQRTGNIGFMIDMDYAISLDNYAPDVDDERSGTPAFMACEVASLSAISLPGLPIPTTSDKSNLPLDQDEDVTQYRDVTMDFGTNLTQPFFHSLSHDLESFFWVILWLCLCCAGPARRRDFSSVKDFNNDKKHMARVATWSMNLFESTNWQALGTNKADVLRNPLAWQNVQACVHPYFNPLLPLLRGFRRILSGLLGPEGRGDEKAKLAGEAMVDLLWKCVETPGYIGHDLEGGAGATAEHNASRQNEIKRRKLLGWLPKVMQSPSTAKGSQPLASKKGKKRAAGEVLNDSTKRTRSGGSSA